MGICPFLSGILFTKDGTYKGLQRVNCLQSACQLWDSEANECSLKNSSSMLTKIHKGANKLKPPKASLLLQEYQGGQDMDGNRMVYGRDFMINPNDPQIPKMIKTIQAQSDFPQDIQKLSWQEYLKTITTQENK